MALTSLTPEGLAGLLSRLHPDPAEAAVLYEQIRRRLIRMFAWRGCGQAEDLADETFDRVARRLLEGATIDTPDPYRYFCGVAYRVSSRRP